VSSFTNLSVTHFGLLNVLNYITLLPVVVFFFCFFLRVVCRLCCVLFTFVYCCLCCVIRGLIRWPCGPSPHNNKLNCNTYLCESGISTLTLTKSKTRNILKTDTLNATLRVSLSPVKPRLDQIISKKLKCHINNKSIVFSFYFVSVWVYLFGHRPKFFEMTEKKLSQFGHNVRKGR